MYLEVIVVKKIALLFVCVFLFLTSPIFAIESETVHLKPNWDSVAPDRYANIRYIEPIKRGKWVMPTSWFVYFGTLGLVPIPLIIKQKDENIAKNNVWCKYKQNFENDLANCEILYKNNKEKSMCYQNVRNTHINFLNMILTDAHNTKIEKATNAILIQNSRPKYYHSTTTQYGNTIHTNGYAY